MGKPIEKSKKKYMEYVQKKLKKYKVDSPSKVPNKHKTKFYKELDKGWESKEEKAKKKEKKKAIVQAVLDKIAPKQPPKGWWDMMHTKVKKDNPEYDKETLDKVIGDIWYNKMKGPKKKEVLKEYES